MDKQIKINNLPVKVVLIFFYFPCIYLQQLILYFFQFFLASQLFYLPYFQAFLFYLIWDFVSCEQAISRLLDGEQSIVSFFYCILVALLSTTQDKAFSPVQEAISILYYTFLTHVHWENFQILNIDNFSKRENRVSTVLLVLLMAL